MMDRWVAGLARLGEAWRQPAHFRIELDELYRLEAHWALTLTQMGSIHLSAAQLRHLRTCLDFWSSCQVWWRSRRRVGPETLAIRESTSSLPSVGRSIRVSDDYYGRDWGGDAFYYPYPMHPWVYAMGWHRRVGALRRAPRRYRLFFSGVVNEGYADRFDFPMMTRPAVLECVLDAFRSEACVVASRADLPALRRTDRPIVLVLFGGDVTPMASNHFLPRPSYLRMLARSEFALCPPGVFMPHSHNLVEAMAVGSIPVTNYPDFCRPELADGRTCLSFSTPDDLCGAVRRALAAPRAEIHSMREAVIRNYDEELSPRGTARKLAKWLALAGPDSRLVLNREFATARLWSEAKAGV